MEAISKAVDLALSINDASEANDRICVATLSDIDEELAKAMTDRKVTFTRLSSYDDVEKLAYTKKSIVVAPWQFIGGTQFSHVIVLMDSIEKPRSRFEKLKELISVYLSCSRAAKSLNVVTSGHIPEVIMEAMEDSLICRK
jgi:hypothetical protein